MTWQLGAFAILALGLAGGFGWYEHTRPDARVVALVGTLAAFAALGRIAFAAIPNVKPTTDIVLISGYALGGGPGFVVGAVAALSSNFFFGQGPWTPWQMAGWGITGLLGAGLARLVPGRIGRWPLALICFVVGFAFTALQDFGDWVTYSDHSFEQLAVYVGKGIGFDLIHATGCLLFALALGPALIASLSRFRVRLQVTWLPPTLGAVLAVALLAGGGQPAAARAAATPTSYLLSAQNSDGGYGPAPGAGSSSLFSGWAAMGLAAAGQSPASTSHGGPTLLAYLEAHSGGNYPGSLERSILAIHAGGGPVAGLLARLQRQVRANGSVRDQTNLTAFAVLAERAAGGTPAARSIRWLTRQQDADGGFNFATAPGQSDVDDTGAVLEVLAGTGHHATIRRAVRFLRRTQNRNGGWPSQPGSASNAQSTAFAVQGLDAVGVALGSLPRSPVAYLQGLIGPDGQVAYARGQDQTPVWVTAQAELALAGKPLPVAAVAAARVGRVNHKSPARRKAPARTRARARRKAGRRRSRAGHPRRPMTHLGGPEMRALSADAGVLTALVLAPVGL